jgi:folate-binding protein YgfZ
MPHAAIPDRALIAIVGPDAEHLLQNVITTDLDKLAPGEAMGGALLSPQGKILFDFLISRDGADGFRLECRADVAADLARRLTLYRLRAKAQISVVEGAVVQVWWESDSGASRTESRPDGALRDRRFVAAAVWRSHDVVDAGSGDLEGWQAFRIEQGIAESGSDYALGEAFPHDVLLDQTGSVGLRKGCYVGQEVVSRMQHRGTARRRVLVAESDGPLPQAGAEITADGRMVGTLGSSSRGRALALVRIDKVKAAMNAGVPILADGAVLTLSIPAWATFRFPEDNAAADDA